MKTIHSLSSLLLAVVMAAPIWAQSVWTVPGVANAGGVNNTRFVSDLTISNPGAAGTQAAISFLPSPGPNTKSITLSGGETVVYRNVLDSLFGTTGAGALSISSAQPLLIRARTYNTAPSGTFGLALPVYEADRLLAAGEIGDSLWVSQDASPSSGYRTNIAVVFPDETGGTATVTVYDADGNEKGNKDFALDAAGFQQVSVGGFAGAVAVGRARLHVTRGRAAGYSVVVDNVTGDSSLFTFEDLPGGRQDVLVSGVARANGKFGTFFRTDGRFYNPTDTDATVRVAFHASGNSNPTPATATFTLPAGKVRDVVDVLDALLGLPVGSAGALRFQSDWPVAILCRTSNVDPTGARPGTFGSQQKPVPLLTFLTSADAGAAITGIRQDASYRTNIGFAAGEDGARYTLTLTKAAGGVVATTSASLGSFGWAQPGMQALFPSVTIPGDATLLVRVTEGSLDVFDSSNDNLSGDPVVTPAAALPATIPSSATIGPQGGSIRSSDGRLTLKIPAGALSQPTPFSLQETTNDAPQGTGPGYQLSPSGVTFARSALLTLAYTRADTQNSSSEALTIASRAGADWYVLGDGTVDPVRHSLTVPLPSMSPTFGPSSQARRPFADGNAELAVVRSWELRPAGKWAVPTRGRLSLSVYAVGPPSSRSVLDFVTGKLSTSPLEVEAIWFVNGWRNGNSLDGVILYDGAGGTLSVKYLAPDCPPRGNDNPVAIWAYVANNGGFFKQWYQATGVAQVRVLYRSYKFTATQELDIKCPLAPASDHATFEASFVLNLDDNLTIKDVVLNAPTQKYAGDPVACPSDPPIRNPRRKPSAGLTVNFTSGTYDAEKEAFELNLGFTVTAIIGYNYEEFDGSKWVSKEWPAVSVPVPSQTLPDLMDGFHVASSGLTGGLSLNLKHDEPGCP
jgi:hypothetical protein